MPPPPQPPLFECPFNILHGLDSGWTRADLGLPHLCPSWLGIGWAGPSAAQVLGLAHLLAGACPIDWNMPKQLIGLATAGACPSTLLGRPNRAIIIYYWAATTALSACLMGLTTAEILPLPSVSRLPSPTSRRMRRSYRGLDSPVDKSVGSAWACPSSAHEVLRGQNLGKPPPLLSTVSYADQRRGSAQLLPMQVKGHAHA